MDEGIQITVKVFTNRMDKIAVKKGTNSCVAWPQERGNNALNNKFR